MTIFRHKNGDHLTDDDLSAFVDGALEDGRIAAAETHIASCEVCSGRIEELRSVRSMLASLPAVDARRSFRLTPAMAGIERPAAASRPRGYAFAPALALSLLVALLFVDFAVIGESGRSSLSSAEVANDAFAPSKQRDESTAGAAASAEQAQPPPAAAAIPQPADATPMQRTFSAPSASPAAPNAAGPVPPQVPAPAQAAPMVTATAAVTDSLAYAQPGESAGADGAERLADADDNEATSARGLIRLLEVIAAGAFVGSLLAVWRMRSMRGSDR